MDTNPVMISGLARGLDHRRRTEASLLGVTPDRDPGAVSGGRARNFRGEAHGRASERVTDEPFVQRQGTSGGVANSDGRKPDAPLAVVGDIQCEASPCPRERPRRVRRRGIGGIEEHGQGVANDELDPGKSAALRAVRPRTGDRIPRRPRAPSWCARSARHNPAAASIRPRAGSRRHPRSASSRSSPSLCDQRKMRICVASVALPSLRTVMVAVAPGAVTSTSTGDTCSEAAFAMQADPAKAKARQMAKRMFTSEIAGVLSR